MPVHSRGDKKETNHHDEMEVDYAENEGSSSEDEDTESSSVSEDGDSSEMDDEDCERRRMECLDEMSNLEKQFTDLKDQLYKERLSQVDAKLQEVIAGKAPEYLEPLATLQENMQIRTKVAGIYRELCLESVKNKYECEIQASRQHCESEKLLLYDTVQSELEEKIRRLEEDRHSIDITSELWNDELQSRKKRKDPFSPDKKKPVVVSGPYIVYMLQDLDILEDWTTIRKAMATLGPHRVKTELFELIPLAPVKLEKHLHSARSEEGRLYYDGEWYIRGQTICIDKKDECPTSAVITTINHDEVWFKRPDGSKSKLYISQLQKGKYSIKHS
ncbi:breast cancer metastasis-suppressor 1-like protein isoform X1 [Bos indicus]|uniref:BRMS1 like transcriptional repressor n=16 Tax=Boreoeutheria TaxID=1437010 RepID=A0ABI7X2X7_FELCA|nr:breast cancer metastasis-suppressor 1-like protein isoform X1 [Mustela putorius furo]XP_005268185.1 breast cancer metastasis-suppressor 1-like protein isoform X1 [Homo sapiens]XP_005623385.1 breast cancer metastasis-suppressor 1-like protein isoform X1 [Canis lupus familiaris]XP_006932866.1 breast cancer metastasis-suppressor 1-like protein isoform X1 [Felis catus]XP_007073786.1 breast cancer metastasis-suppressor 1-like protein isoform X1 [Panthera tigris]XP_008692274.1 breast cancer metas|eukprot:XP_005268185.1 breast cancer metastasis-suppressor 1-like protein isoform X1 [Homo sapiens]